MSAPTVGDPCREPVERLMLPGRQRVRVVQVLATGTNGGAQEHVFGLATRLDPSRYEVSVVSLSAGSSVRKLQRAGVPVSVIETTDDDEAVAELMELLCQARPDVIHNHMYRAEIIGTRAAMALGATGARRPWIVSTVHSSRIRSTQDREAIRILTPQMDQLVAVSRSIERKLIDEERLWHGGPPVSLIYNGVDLERYDQQDACCTLREEYAMEPGSPIVGIVARLEPEKGHATLLDAWPLVLRSVPDAYLLVVGEGSRAEDLIQQAHDLGIRSRVLFTGRRDDVPAVTAALDVAVLPSYREAQGLSLLEAMALSRPVVASNVGGIPEMIDDGVTGLLVPPHDAEALAAAIVRLLTDHPLADMLARAGHDVVHSRFCIQLMVHALEAIYDAGARRVREPEVAAAG